MKDGDHFDSFWWTVVGPGDQLEVCGSEERGAEDTWHVFSRGGQMAVHSPRGATRRAQLDYWPRALALALCNLGVARGYYFNLNETVFLCSISHTSSAQSAHVASDHCFGWHG